MSPKSRLERHRERYRELHYSIPEEERAELVEQWPGTEEDLIEHCCNAETAVRKEDEQLWALYRQVADSQQEAIDILDPGAEISQSTASRAIKRMNTEIFIEPILSIERDLEKAEYVEMWPDNVAAAYRDVVARAIADVMALSRIRAFDEKTPDWALERFPELAGAGYRQGMLYCETDGYSTLKENIVSQRPPDARNP